LYGCDAAEGGWQVQIYDCIGADVGALTSSSISFSGNGGCGASTITYNSGAINSAINDNACSAATASVYTVPPTAGTPAITITNTVTYQWTASPAYAIPNATTSLTPSINPAPTVDTWFYLTVTDNKGCSKKDSAFFDYQPSTTPVITPAGPFCANGAAATLTANVGGGTWSGTGITNAAAGTFNPASAVIGPNTITYTTPGACGATTTATITVNALPTATIPASATYCQGALVPAATFATVPAGGTLTWTNTNTTIGTGASGSGNIPGFTAANGGSTTISGTIAVTPTLNGCTGLPSSYTLTVNPLPSLTTVSSQTVCANANTTAINFTSNPAGATVNWTNSNTAIGITSPGSGNIASFTGTNPGASSLTGNFSATPTLNTCVGTPITFSITIDPLPTVNAVASQTLCANASTTPVNFTTNPVGGTIGWTNSDPSIGMTAFGSGGIPAFTGLNSSAIAVTGNFTAVATLNSCIGPPQNFSITVDPLPVLTAVSSQTVCSTTTTAAVSFTSNPSGATVNWTNDNSAIGIGSGASGNIPSFTGTNATSSPITGNFTATATLNTCVGPTINFSIVISPSPTLAVVPNQTVCEGLSSAPVNFNPNPAIATIDWTNSDPTIGLAASGTGNISSFITANGTGVSLIANLTATPSIGVCIGPPQNFTITIDPTPILTAIPSQTICETTNSAAINFTTNPTGATVNWTNSNTIIGAPASGVNTVASFTGFNGTSASISGNFVATPVLGSCTGGAQNFTITVDPTPTLAAIGNQTVCEGLPTAAINFSPTPSGVINWTNSNPTIGLPASGAGNISFFTAANGTGATITGNFIATPSIGICSGPPQNFSITVNPGVVVNPPSNIVVCNTGTVAPSAFTSTPAGATYTWTNNDPSIGLAASGIGDFASFTASNIVTTPIVATISVTPTLNGCLGPAVNYNITVNPTPAPPVVATVTYCLNDIAIALTATPAAGGTLNWWGTIPGGGPSSATSPMPSTATENTTNYYVSQVVTLCESPRTLIQVVVNPLPSITAPANITVCSGVAIGAQNFTSNPIGATLAWTNSNGTIGLPVSGTGNIPGFNGSNTTTSVQTGTVTVTPTLTGCVGTPVTYTININPIPTVAVSNVVVCNNASVATTTWASVPAGATFTWVNSNTSIGLSANGAGNIASFSALNGTTIPATAFISVTPTLNSCVGPVSNYTITVNPTPSAPGTTNVTYCVNDAAVALIASPSAGGALNWYGMNPTNGTASPNAPVPPTTSALTSTYYVSQTISNCEGPRSPLTVIVNPLPVAALSPSVSGCEPFVTTLSVSSVPQGVDYDWTMGNGTVNDTNIVSNYLYAVPGFYSISVKVTDVNNCIATTSFPNWITVFSKPVPDFYAQPQPVSILNPSIDFINASTGTGLTAFQWSFGDPLNSQSFLADPTFDYSNAGVGTFMVELIATNANGCKDTITKPIIVEDDFAFYIPNAFSPNGDGINDSFYPKWTGVDEKQYEFWIFDRWGNQLFFTNDPTRQWDGAVAGKGTDPVQEDVYLWKIKCKTIKGDRKQLVGHVTVVR
ncbi:MAG: gliding motility-associated C-terminal domain-containing protein, partial [Bacteroidia bacterium]